MRIGAEGPSRLAGTCGASVVYQFHIPAPEPSWNGQKRPSWYSPPRFDSYNDLRRMNLHQGAGWLTAGFINTPQCREAYAILCSRYKVVLQTKKRNNYNSNNTFFFMVFDTKPARGARAGRPSWVGKRSGAPKPQALIDWEATGAVASPPDNSQYKWPF